MPVSRAAVFLLAVLLAGCAGAPEPACRAGLKPMTMAELFFGRAMTDGKSVSDAEWQSFVDTEITPRFPAGFTVADGAGQWQSGTAILREAAKRLSIVLPGLPSDSERLDAIRRAYLNRFHQEAVLLFEQRGCGSFDPPP